MRSSKNSSERALSFPKSISPRQLAGQILERHVAVGQRFNRGELLYRMANLERVWVLADVHPGDAPSLIRAEGPGSPWKACRPYWLNPPRFPQFDEQGRTGKLRLT